jgi:hypothetical protein
MPKIHFREKDGIVPVNMQEENAKREMKAEIRKRVDAMREAGIT